MGNLISKRLLNSSEDRLNYKSAKLGVSSGNLANFATFKERNLAGNSLFGFFFSAFFYTSLDFFSEILKKSEI